MLSTAGIHSETLTPTIHRCDQNPSDIMVELGIWWQPCDHQKNSMTMAAEWVVPSKLGSPCCTCGTKVAGPLCGPSVEPPVSEVLGVVGVVLDTHQVHACLLLHWCSCTIDLLPTKAHTMLAAVVAQGDLHTNSCNMLVNGSRHVTQAGVVMQAMQVLCGMRHPNSRSLLGMLQCLTCPCTKTYRCSYHFVVNEANTGMQQCRETGKITATPIYCPHHAKVSGPVR